MSQLVLTSVRRSWSQARFDIPEGMDVNSEEFEDWKDSLWDRDDDFEEIDSEYTDFYSDID